MGPPAPVHAEPGRPDNPQINYLHISATLKMRCLVLWMHADWPKMAKRRVCACMCGGTPTLPPSKNRLPTNSFPAGANGVYAACHATFLIKHKLVHFQLRNSCISSQGRLLVPTSLLQYTFSVASVINPMRPGDNVGTYFCRWTSIPPGGNYIPQ